MKNLIRALLIALIGSSGIDVMAQQTAGGIYLTEQDYKNHKLSYTLTPHDKMQLNEFLDGKRISLTYQGKKIELAKSDIFGYRLHDKDYRLFQNSAYSILDTTGFTLYSREQLTQQVKGYKPVERYYFSANPARPILELTLKNLETGFPEQPRFRYSLQNYFNKDADLAAYDKAIGQYKIKYLYLQQKQPLNAHQNNPD